MDCTPEQSPTSGLWDLQHLFPTPLSYLNSSRFEPQQIVLEETPFFNTYFTSGAVSSIGKTSKFLDLPEFYFLNK